ncbi:MAG: hypothetical protein U5N86_02840 [Planctomycetota bacterium]|nr:hypothetical protein [Planctomycetota bacterium]
MDEFERAEPASKNIIRSAGLDAKLVSVLLLVCVPASGIWYLWNLGWLESWTARLGVGLVVLFIASLVVVALSGRKQLLLFYRVKTEDGVHTIDLRASGKMLNDAVHVKAHVVLYKDIRGKPNISPGFLASTELERDETEEGVRYRGSLTISQTKVTGGGFRRGGMEPGILVTAGGRSELFEAPLETPSRLF